MDNSKFIDQINNDGYAVIPNLISAAECDFYKYLSEQDYRNYANLYCNSNATKGEQANKTGEKVVFNLHNKHLSWFKLFEHPEILSILDVILKEGHITMMNLII